MELCNAKDCNKERYCKDYCIKHYHRYKKYGDPEVVRWTWTDPEISEEIKKCMSALVIERMPTANELKSLGRNDLHCVISRTKKYSGWAEELGLSLKSCDTRTGQAYESETENMLIHRGYKVERMSTKHPYDLLVNDHIKIDVKIAKPHILRGESKVHTFSTRKENPTCDIYFLIALDEKEKIERILIIPSVHMRIQTLCIGANSKYNKFINRWDYIEKYDEFYKNVI